MSLFFGGGTGIGSDASWFLTECDQDEKDGSNGDDRIILDALKKSLLEAASHQTAWPSTRRWDDYAILTYWTGCIGARVSNKCEVIVQSFAPQHHTSIDHPPLSPDVSFSRYAPTPKTPVTTEPSFSITFLRDIPSLTQSSTLVHPTRYPPETVGVQVSSEIPETSPAVPQEAAGEQTISPPDDLEDHSDPGNIKKYFKSMDHVVDPSTFKDMVENLPQMCFLMDNQGTVQYFSKAWYRYTGLLPENLSDVANWVHFFHADDMPSTLLKWAVCLKTGEDLHHEYRVKSAAGEFRWFFVKAVALRGTDGIHTAWVATLTDINELVKVRSDALRIKEHVTAVLTGAEIVLLTVDRDSIVSFYEGSNLSVGAGGTGPYAKGHFIGKHLREVWPSSKLLTAVEDIFASNREHITWLAKSEDGGDQHSYRYRLIPLRGGDGALADLVSGVIVVAADVTSFVAIELELQKAKLEQQELMVISSAAKEASRLKTSFVTNISHEVRTPIASVIGIAEILLDDETLQSDHRALVEKSLRSGKILLDLIGMVLDMGKLESGMLTLERRPFRLSEALSDVGLSVMSRKQNVVFVESIDSYFQGNLDGDYVRLRQIISNGLSNAVKFTHTGKIIFTVRQESETDTQCNMLFVIQDTGIGIQKSVLKTLFVPFQQADASTSRNYGGSGLGLVIAKTLAELMGGSIQLDSISGVGTTMTIRIPFDKATSQRKKAPVAPPGAVRGVEGTRDPSTIHILLAEDNALVSEILSRILNKMKFKLTLVEDGASAVKAVEEGSFDLVLMDGQMPLVDGYEATSRIRKLLDPVRRAIPIIALTASAFVGDRQRCIDAGMNSYLSKPVSSSVLLAAIWEQLPEDVTSHATVCP